MKQPKNVIFKSKGFIDLKIEWSPDFAEDQNERVRQAQITFDREFLQCSLRRMPFKSNNFINRTLIANARAYGTGLLVYPGPYARMLDGGKIMVGVLSRSAYAKKNEQKVVTDKDLQFSGAPERGAHWVERTWNEDGDKIMEATQAAYDKGVKR